jgi:predicted metalloprotease with PDZ domain
MRIKTLLCRGILTLFVVLFIGQCLQARDLAYDIAPIFGVDQSLRGFKISLRFKGDLDGSTHLNLPEAYGQATHLYRNIRQYSCKNAQLLQRSPDSTQILLHHAPDQWLEFNFQLKPTRLNNLPVPDTYLYPVIGSDYFQFIGATAFVVPTLGSADTFNITVSWIDFPPEWQLLNSFGKGLQQYLSAADARWLESVWIGGTRWRMSEQQCMGQPVWTAIRGDDWAFPDDSLRQLSLLALTHMRRFWRDTTDWPFYLITLTPLESNSDREINYAGVGLRQAFSMYAIPHRQFGMDYLRHLMFHELMHEWIGGKIRTGGSPNDMRFAWFIEGFTEYQALQMQWQMGYLSATQYAQRVNEQYFKPLWSSPHAQSPNSLIEAQFFSVEQVRQLPYQRGFVAAWVLDQAIRRKSKQRHDLGDFLRDGLGYYHTAQGEKSLMTHFDYFEQILNKYSGLSAKNWINKHLTEGILFDKTQLTAPSPWTFDWSSGIPVLSSIKK